MLALTRIEKSFGGVRALRGVDFSLHAGEVHALVGENGAGKSTLIKIITGAHEPDAGSIELDGQTVTPLTPALARARGIACIYQKPGLFPDLTVTENLALRLEPPRAFRRVDWAARKARAIGLLQRVGAKIDPGSTVDGLSMPEQQLVEIACAIGAGARIVIMDEPTACLTRHEQRVLFDVVRTLAAGGTGVIYISHRLEEIFELATRVSVLRDVANVGTHPVSQIDEAKLIHLMVGREVTQIHPPREAPPGRVVLDVRGLTSRAAGVSDVSFELRAGEVFGLAGLVGAGRTELACTLFGMHAIDSGEVRLDGEVIHLYSPQHAVDCGIACVPENRPRHGVIAEMPIEQNMTLAIMRRLFRGGWLRFGAERALAEEFMRKLAVKAAGPGAAAATLSGGNQQKVALARWLATKPRVLILDEPTQGVDVGTKSEVHRIIRALARDGLAVILISSDLPEVLGMSDRIGVMRGGRLAEILAGGATAHDVMSAAFGQESGRGAA